MRLRLENGASKTKSIAEPKRRELPSKSRTSCRSCGASSDMGKRRRAREAAIQYHFWRDLQRGETPERMDDFWDFCPVKPNRSEERRVGKECRDAWRAYHEKKKEQERE